MNNNLQDLVSDMVRGEVGREECALKPSIQGKVMHSNTNSKTL